MLNNLRFDWFVMRKRLSTYVCGLLPAFLVLSYYMLFWMVSRPFSSLSQVKENLTEIFTSNMPLNLVIWSVYFVMFLGAETKHGFVKNVAGSIRSKSRYVISKMILMLFFILLSMAILTLASVCCGVMFSSGGLNFDANAFFSYVGKLTVLLTGLMCLITCVFMLTRSTSGAMVFAITAATRLLSSLIASLGTMLLARFDIKFDFNKIFVSAQLYSLDTDMTGEQTMTALAVGAAYIVIFGTLSCVLFNKKDIT